MKLLLRLTFLFLVLLTGVNCGKNTPHNPGGLSGCVVLTCPSYFGTTQTFTYDQSRNMTKRSYDFNYPGYSTFTQTVNKNQTFYSYTHNGSVIEETDIFVGGTGNLYDGTPDFMIRKEHQTNPGMSDYNAVDTLYTFAYDGQKRLNEVDYIEKLDTYDVYSTYSRQLFLVKLNLTLDGNGNVTRMVQSDIYRYGVYNVNSPSESRFYYDSVPWTVINFTYDNKPSPFSATLKYWKFVQGDWGMAINSNWLAIITALSPNNPLTMQYELSQGNATSQKSTMVYNYTDKGYPSDSYTYDCF